MKKLFSKLGITILAFALGIMATALWFYFNPKLESFDEVNFSTIPTLKQCDLKNNPRQYDGKIVRLQDEIKWYQHGYFFEDANCLDKGETGRTAVWLYEPKRKQLYKELESPIPNERWQSVKITAVGRFSYKWLAHPIGSAGNIEDRTSLHFEIFQIEAVERK